MNRCKQCGQEIWESETTCAECEERSTALVLRKRASFAGEAFPALDKVEPKPASANASPFEAIFSEAALEPAKIRIKPAPADVKPSAFDEPPAPTDDELEAAAFAEDDFDPVLDYATRVAQQEAELVASHAPAVSHAAPALSAAPAAAATAVMEPPIMKSAPAASAPAAKAAPVKSQDASRRAAGRPRRNVDVRDVQTGARYVCGAHASTGRCCATGATACGTEAGRFSTRRHRAGGCIARGSGHGPGCSSRNSGARAKTGDGDSCTSCNASARAGSSRGSGPCGHGAESDGRTSACTGCCSGSGNEERACSSAGTGRGCGPGQNRSACTITCAGTRCEPRAGGGRKALGSPRSGGRGCSSSRIEMECGQPRLAGQQQEGRGVRGQVD